MKYKFEFCKRCGCKLLYKEEYDMCYSCHLDEERSKGKLICPGTIFLAYQTMKFRSEDDD